MAKRLRMEKETPGGASLARSFVSTALSAPWQLWLRVGIITLVTAWIYWPAVKGGFVWDDTLYILDNPLLRDVGGLWRIWFEPGSSTEYYPLEETTQWLEWQLWADRAMGYHVVNIILHIASSLLVWRLFSKFDLRLAWWGGLIFALHPAQVESVAWIVELKNTLSLPFFLLAMCFWIDYDAHRQKRDYVWALLFFLLAMLCKLTMITFPFVLLLYAWWKHGRLEWSDVKESIPFFFVSVALGGLTVWAAHRYDLAAHNQPDMIFPQGLLAHFLLIGQIMGFYFSRVFWPVDYLPAYPKEPVNPFSPIEYLPWVAGAVLAFMLFRLRRSWARPALLGLGYFVVLLAPFIGFLPLKSMSFTWAMDHFLYIPIIGLIGLLVAGLGLLESRFPLIGRYVGGGLAVTVLFLAIESRAIAGLFVNDETLWTYTLQRDPNSWIAHFNLGSALLDQKRYRDAITQIKLAIALRPAYGDDYFNLGIALDKLGRTPEAEEQYRTAMKLEPGSPRTYLNLGELMIRTGNLVEAESLFRQGLKISPDAPSLQADLGGILLKTGRLQEAIGFYQEAVASNPDVAGLQYDLGAVLFQTGNFPQAGEHFELAVKLDPQMTAAHENLGVILARSGRLSEAIDQFSAVLEINPQAQAARDNLALALAQSGRIPEAIEQFKVALEKNPADAKARAGLAQLQALPAGTPAKF